MIKVHQLRAGAPDKIMLAHSDSYELVKHDNCNLVDFTFEHLVHIQMAGEYILPADEGDIKYANDLACSHGLRNDGFILLPQRIQNDGDKGDRLHTINYGEFVPKNSDVYKLLETSTGIKYATYCDYSIEQFVERYTFESFKNSRCALKTATGSGSRGVWLIDPERIHLGGKYVSELSKVQFDEFLEFAEKENCEILIQDLIPNDPKLTKVNVDFVIRDGQLLGYKWDKTDPTAVFTNWNFGWFIRNEYTDSVMIKIAEYLTQKYGIVNAIMNFEAFSDLSSETWLVEFNWRYSNSMFEWQALGIDPIQKYLDNENFFDSVPFGEHKFSRYWQCALYNDIPDYHSGI